MHLSTASRVLPAVALAAVLTLAGCPAPTQPGDDLADQVGRFSIRRLVLKRDSVLVRTDTATGETWHMRLLGEGKWEPYAESELRVPSPDGRLVGRYQVRPHNQRRGAPTLVRLDTVTGQIWRVGSTGLGHWVPVAQDAAAGESAAEAAAEAQPPAPAETP